MVGERNLCMWLNKIQITNFKGIQNAAFHFDSQFNLIIGDNGTGKTSVLEAISVALGAFLAGIDGINTIHFSCDEIRRENELLGEGSNNIIYRTPIKVECDLTLDNEPMHFIRQKKSINSSRSTIEPRDICKKAADLAANKNSILPIISYQGFSRISNQKREKWEDVFRENFSRIVGYTDCLDEASNTKLLTNWFKKMEQISWQQGKKIAEYECVKNAVSSFMESMLDISNIHIYYDKRTEELIYSNADEMLPLRFLSSGFRTLIGMVLDIAYRMAVLNPDLLSDIIRKTPGIVLIDEIDMHLHPKWQWRVVKALKQTFPKVQFVATTHSPLIIASSYNENIISLKNTTSDSGYSLQPTYSKSAKGWQIDDVLEDIMETGNRDPETLLKMGTLTELSKKKKLNLLSLDETEKYFRIIEELRELLPEDDIGIEEATFMAINDILEDEQ